VIALQASSRRVKILVEDSGIGINQAHFDSIFAGNSFGKSLSTGGIGLLLSNKIAQELGFEEIQLISEPGVGSCFSFYVCATDYLACEATPKLHSSSPQLDVGEFDHPQCAPIFNTSECRQNMADKCADFLLVDDYPFNRMVVRTFLSKEGFTVQEAENGQHAVDLVRNLNRQKQHFRLILMDIDMPVLDGIQATEKLIAMKISDPDFVLPPIIGHSAFTSDEDITKYMEVGMQGFLPKPFTRDMAMDLIRKVIISPGK
jgi:CheY-like chemotaxis protein